MTTSEIRALQDALYKDGDDLAYNAATAIETLLTRQAEALDRLKPGEEPYDYQFSFNLYPQRDFQAAYDAWIDKRETYDDIHAILNPENESVYAMTKGEVRHYQNHLRDRAEIEGRD